jgi:hypothetical protein
VTVDLPVNGRWSDLQADFMMLAQGGASLLFCVWRKSTHGNSETVTMMHLPNLDPTAPPRLSFPS